MVQADVRGADRIRDCTWLFNTALPETRKQILYLQSAGHFTALPGYYMTREGYDSFLIKVTVSGCGKLTYGGRSYQVPAGQFYWIDCNLPHDYRIDPQADSWHMYGVHLHGPTARFFYESFLQFTGGHPVGQLPQNAPVYDLLRQMIDICAGEASQLEKDLRFSMLLNQLLTQLLLSANTPAPQTSATPYIRQISDYLAANHNRKVTLQELSLRFSMSPSHLQRQFKACYGLSPTEYLIHLRIVHAKEQLRSTEKPVSQIAEETGFDSSSYLSRLFRQYEGVTPQEYRKQWKQMANTPVHSG